MSGAAGVVAEERSREAVEAPSWRGPVLALALCVVGAGCVLLAGGQAWANATATLGSIPLPVVATGRDLSAIPEALGILALAGGLAVLAARRVGRLITGVVLAAAGVGVLVKAVGVLADVRAAVEPKAAAAAGQTGVAVSDARGTAWIWLTAIGGVLIVAGGAFTMARAHAWPRMSARYERPRRARRGTGHPPRTPQPAGARSGRAPRQDPATPREIWSALDRGEDPT